MITNTLDNIYKKIGTKYGKDRLTTKRILNSIFEFTRKVIEEGNDETVNLMYLGKFKVKEFRRISKTDKEKLNDNSGDQSQ